MLTLRARSLFVLPPVVSGVAVGLLAPGNRNTILLLLVLPAAVLVGLAQQTLP